jgi:hypothetical protein
MEFPQRDVALAWVGRTLVDRDGSEIGACTAVFTDDATQVTEWVCSDVDGTAVFIPAVGATESGDQVQLFVRRDDVAAAPPVGGPEHITGEEEAALYRHYGIPHSREASPTVLPTGEPESTGTDAAAVPATPAADSGPQPVPDASQGSTGGRRLLPAAGGLAAAGMAVGSVLVARRLRRRRPPTRTERILARKDAAVRALTAGTGRIAASAAPLAATSARAVRRPGAVVLPVAAAATLAALRRRRSRSGPDAYEHTDDRKPSPDFPTA